MRWSDGAHRHANTRRSRPRRTVCQSHEFPHAATLTLMTKLCCTASHTGKQTMVTASCLSIVRHTRVPLTPRFRYNTAALRETKAVNTGRCMACSSDDANGNAITLQVAHTSERRDLLSAFKKVEPTRNTIIVRCRVARNSTKFTYSV